MKVALMTVGTRGDVQPFVALALGLEARGHRVTLAAPPNSRSFVEGFGLAYREVGTDVAELLSRPEVARHGGSATFIDFIRLRKRFAEQMFYKAGLDILPLFDWADTVVYKTPLTIAYCLARLKGLPCVEAGLVPLYPTRANAGLLFAGRSLGSVANLIVTSFTRKAIWLATKKSVDALRAEIEGLDPYSHYARRARAEAGEFPVLFAISPSVYQRPADWGGNVRLTGYWFLPPRAEWRPPEEISSFLDRGGAPIYFGFGSMTCGDPARVMGAIREALRRLGARGIVSRGWARLEDGEARSQDILFIDDVPHDWLFPRVAVAVHHGGAGTTAAALRAGIPSVIVPHIGDQPMWGRLLWKLGAAPRSIGAKKLSASGLEQALCEALAGGRMGARARELATAIAAEDGVAEAAAAIEAYAASRRVGA